MKIKAQFMAGAKDGIPVVFGFIPVAIAYAVMAGQAGLGFIQTCFMSILVYAGASQMLAVGMFAQGAGILSIILATFMLNFRHVIMSTCVMRHLIETSIPKKLLLSFGVTDEAFAIFTTTEESKRTAPYFMGLALVTYLSWILGSVLGCLVNQILPEVIQNSFGIALYAMFLGLLFPAVKKGIHITMIIMISAIMSTVFHRILPSSWAMIVTTLVGAFIGIFMTSDKEESTI